MPEEAQLTAGDFDAELIGHFAHLLGIDCHPPRDFEG
jgi:hypothetical protein